MVKDGGQRLGTIEDPHGPLADPWVLPRSTHVPSQTPYGDSKEQSGTVRNGQDGATSEK